MNDQVITHLLDKQTPILDWMKDFLRIPSVSADPGFDDSMHEARNFLVQRFTEIGLDNVQLLDGGGQPAVYGESLRAPGKPTIIIYGHYDVQPADPLEEWLSPPFEPTIRDGCLFARGSSDVKGSTAIAIETVAAFLAVEGDCPINVKFFIEGEEETGSPSLRAIVDKYRELLQADGVLSADGGRASREIPTINTGARGNNALEFSIRAAKGDMHSGRYGGAVRNALHDMAAIVTSLHSSDGTVTVKDFDIDATAPTQRQIEDTAAFPFDQRAFLDHVGAVAHGDPAYTTREQLTLRPSIEVNGMWGGYTGNGVKTIVPAQAHAKITIRTVSGQDPIRAIESVRKHLIAHCPKGVQISFSYVGTGSPASTLSPLSPLVLSAERVLQAEMGLRPIHVRLGATVPITSIFQEMLDIGTLMFGFNLPDEPVHAPNEFFRLESVEKGLRAWTKILRELSTHKTSEFALK
ncbi:MULTISPECIES: dipeptidase [Pseudomonas]|uniref:Dipeptidase n=1 Tax=Pseudomonas vancouverensis TaxID=95300 RepID=A0A1H2MF62_PSEVA|nr:MULTISPECIES: dipeptidase [Pseudomonas]KAB0499110.1 dipeptidase [Pseudomonas vancouverensis]TDB57806.1 dipeptidase [Pseudomonas vancouverensis]SDU91106.1 Acetylornithine deacetylase/Succinyl-diaminopimelate desuccinylase [Pseudomonas vancouverensis]